MVRPDTSCRGCEKRSLDCRKDCKQWHKHELLKLARMKKKAEEFAGTPSSMMIKRAERRNLLSNKNGRKIK